MLKPYKELCAMTNDRCCICKAWLVKGRIKKVDGKKMCKEHPTPGLKE